MRHITLHRPVVNRSKSYPRRFSVHSPAALPNLHASPDKRLSRTDSLACSLTESPRLSGQEAAQDGLTRLQPYRISTPLRTRGCPGRTHSPAASPDLHASPDNRLPRTVTLACSSTGSLGASSPTDYPGTQTPVAAANDTLFQIVWPAAARTQHDTGSTTAQHRKALAYRS